MFHLHVLTACGWKEGVWSKHGAWRGTWGGVLRGLGVPYLTEDVDCRGLGLALPDCCPASCCAGDSCAAVADAALEGVRGGRLVTPSAAAADTLKPPRSVCTVPASGS